MPSTIILCYNKTEPNSFTQEHDKDFELKERSKLIGNFKTWILENMVLFFLQTITRLPPPMTRRQPSFFFDGLASRPI